MGSSHNRMLYKCPITLTLTLLRANTNHTVLICIQKTAAQQMKRTEFQRPAKNVYTTLKTTSTTHTKIIIIIIIIIIIYWYMAAKSWISKHTRKVYTLKCEDKMEIKEFLKQSWELVSSTKSTSYSLVAFRRYQMTKRLAKNHSAQQYVSTNIK